MNTKYCSTCGTRHEFTVNKPKFCSSCGKPLDAAFASIKPAAPVQAPAYQEPVYQEPVRAARTYRDRHGNDISHLYQRSAPVAPVRESGDDDYVDRYEKDRLAAELIASIDPASVSISLSSDTGGPVKLGSLPNIQNLMAQQAAPAKAKRGRKK